MVAAFALEKPSTKANNIIKTIDFLKDVKDYGASRLIYTDIDRDGTKESPNFEETLKVAEASSCPVIISGGVSSISDISKTIGEINPDHFFWSEHILQLKNTIEELKEFRKSNTTAEGRGFGINTFMPWR